PPCDSLVAVLCCFGESINYSLQTRDRSRVRQTLERVKTKSDKTTDQVVVISPGGLLQVAQQDLVDVGKVFFARQFRRLFLQMRQCPADPCKPAVKRCLHRFFRHHVDGVAEAVMSELRMRMRVLRFDGGQVTMQDRLARGSSCQSRIGTLLTLRACKIIDDCSHVFQCTVLPGAFQEGSPGHALSPTTRTRCERSAVLGPAEIHLLNASL